MEEQNDRLPKERELPYTYYQLYRDLPPDERSLRALEEQEVNGKKRSRSAIGKWSKKYNWQTRVAVHDAEAARAAHQERIQRQQAEIAAFIDADMEIAIQLQKLCKSKLDTLDQSGENLDGKELRQVALAYKESREWLKDLIGISPEEEEDGEEAEES